jgi:DNA-binding GntR family transcriptional regulator
MAQHRPLRPEVTAVTLLDQHDPTPIYVQISRYLRRKIVAGEYPNGTTIPSEADLEHLFGTTRGTIRNAIAVLASEGLLRQVRGKGTYVHFSPVNHSIWNFGSFTDYARSRHASPVTKVVEMVQEEHNGERVLHLVRARGISTDSRVDFLHVDHSRISLERFPGLERYDFANDSLYRALREDYDTWPDHSDLTISTVSPDTRARELLSLDEDVHCLTQIDGVIYDADDGLIEHTSVIYSPQARLRLVTTIDAANSRSAG